MHFTPRPYQQQAIDAAKDFFNSKDKHHGIIILPTGSGKSVVIANIAMQLPGKTIVFQPSIEILKQNYLKFTSYGFRAGIYSASANKKFIERITFATIGSIHSKAYLFKDVEHIIIDECHLVNAGFEEVEGVKKGGMYYNFLQQLPHCRIIGCTATPYRLGTGWPDGSCLKFITRTRPKIFSKVIYYIQNKVLFDAGHLAKLEYYSHEMIDRGRLQLNSTGTDFTESSLKQYYSEVNFTGKTIEVANRLLAKRKNLLVFCTMINEALEVMRGIPGARIVTGETPSSERDKLLSDFKNGIVKCVVNVGVLTTGFDYPELEAVLIARSTMSLALYYQMVGRAMRPHKDKTSSWIVDLGGNYNFFGKIETMEIRQDDKGLFAIYQGMKQLTNISFQKK